MKFLAQPLSELSGQPSGPSMAPAPLTDQETAEKEVHLLRLRLTLLRSSLSNLRSELVQERELLRLEKLETFAEPARLEMMMGSRMLEEESRSQMQALQRKQSAAWFGRKLTEVDRQCSQVMDKVRRHMEPLRSIMSHLHDSFPRDQDYGFDSVIYQADDWDAESYGQDHRTGGLQNDQSKKANFSGWGQEDRDMNSYCKSRQLVDRPSDNSYKSCYARGCSVEVTREMNTVEDVGSKSGPLNPNAWLDDELSLRDSFVAGDDSAETITLHSRNSNNEFWAQYD